MNSEEIRPSLSSSSSDEDEEFRVVHSNTPNKYLSSSNSSSSYRSEREVVKSLSHSDSDDQLLSSSESSSLRSSSTIKDTENTPDILRNLDPNNKETSSKSSTTSTYTSEIKVNGDQQEVLKDTKGNSSYSGSSHSKQSYNEDSSITTESEQGLLQSILSDSSSEKITTDLEVASPKDGKFSSSTDDELLRKFREQQANRRFRPRSAKLRRDFEPEPENVERVLSKPNNRSGSDNTSSSDEENKKRKPQHKRLRKGSSSSTSKSSVVSVKNESPEVLIARSEQSNLYELNRTQNESKPEQVTKIQRTITSTGSETRDTLTTSASSPSSDTESAAEDRPPSRQGKRPTSAYPRQRQHSKHKKEEKPKSVQRLLTEKSSPLPVQNPYIKGPIEQGFPWPYTEDIRGGEKSLRRLIDHHKKKLNSLLAQEYLQKHLEVELRKAGAQFREYEREPRPLSPKQIKKFREKNVTWVYLDGRLHNLSREMGGLNTTARRGRERNKVNPKKDNKKRSVSFEKGVGRSSSKSGEKTSLADLLRGRSGKKTKNARRRRSSSADTGSRKSSLSSRSSTRSPSRSTSRTSRASSTEKKQPKKSSSRNSSKASRSRSRSSSKSSSHSSKFHSIFKKDNSRKERPTTAKKSQRARSASSASVSSNKSSSDNKKSKKKKDKKSRSKSSSTSSKDREKHYFMEEKPKLERVLFTEDMEKKIDRKKKKDKSVRIAIAPGLYNTKHPSLVNDNNSFLGRRGDRPQSERHTKQSRDDYNFYKDHNIPGHAFPYYYLSYLLAMDGRKRNRSEDYSQTNRVILTHAPVHRAPAWSTPPKSTRRIHARLPSERRSLGSSPKLTKKKKKTKSVINDRRDESMGRSSSRESASSSLNKTSNSSNSYPRIRPGSGPIKCSWNSEPSTDKPKYPGSDHQLKNTDNPAIQAWLRRKDAQLRARKQNELRKQRKKTSRLIDEQNDIEEKHERALKQYEVWKKAKDREILLRRRKETTEANSAAFVKKHAELKVKKRKERPRTAPAMEQKQSIGSTFSELRSSSASPDVVEKSKPRKPRPKSANTITVSFSNPVFESNTRPRSATPPRKNVDEKPPHSQGFFEKTGSLFKSFLGVGESSKSKNKEQNSQKGIQEGQRSVVTDDRVAYDKWVRSTTPVTNGSSKKNGKKSKKSRKNNQPRLPPHNHSDNDLISNLAKRRIESILASRKKVDTGLKRRPKSGANGLRNPSPPTGNRTDPTTRKWRLRDDDIIRPQIKSSSQNSLGTHSNASSSSSNGGDRRPKFTFSPKTKSRSTRHYRNPVIREAMDRH
uniref:serine/arginine repetitive matrix protein 1-like isoform X1 n=1 Tax=Styela clava TaxID=7725 RepID=UPI0019398790|nr:serine/arginine repetitive matrix protein 1-like isoform X1 [Styela clava]